MERTKRSDAGTVRVTERDMLIFNFLAEMKAMYEPDLRALLGRLTGSAPGEEAIRALIRRWEKAGLARAQKLLARKPRIVWLLPAGARLMGATNWKETSEWTAYHQADVSRVRLIFEGKDDWPKGTVDDWESELRFRQSAIEMFKDGTKNMHIPDAVITWSDGTKSAVEVERSVKDLGRLTRIIERNTSAYPLTIYAIPKAVAEREDETPVQQRNRVTEERNAAAVKRAVRTAYEQVKVSSRVPVGEFVVFDFSPEVKS